MQTYFHGWRRKGGIVTLMLACLAAMEWIEVLAVRSRENAGTDDSSLLEPAIASITLTLLSAYLILRKPRKTPPNA
jgi:hypothetical protein